MSLPVEEFLRQFIYNAALHIHPTIIGMVSHGSVLNTGHSASHKGNWKQRLRAFQSDIYSIGVDTDPSVQVSNSVMSNCPYTVQLHANAQVAGSELFNIFLTHQTIKQNNKNDQRTR